MAGGAKIGCLGARQELRRAEGKKEADGCADKPEDEKVFLLQEPKEHHYSEQAFGDYCHCRREGNAGFAEARPAETSIP